MTTASKCDPILIALLLFFAGTILSFHLTSNYFGASIDEGIYLNDGQRIAAGESIYTDFFAFIGPGVYWIQAVLYSLFGGHLPSQRWSTAISVGAIVGGLSVFGRELGGTASGVIGSLVWLGIWLDLPNRMEVNHRWVSMALFTIAIAILLAVPAARKLLNVIAGLLLAYAVFTTPSFAISVLLIAGYLALRERFRCFAFLAGLGFGCLGLTAILALRGHLGPFFEGMLWAVRNYGEANRFPYGRFPSEVPSRYFLQTYTGAMVIPMSLVIATLYGWFKRDERLVAPIVYCLALFAATYPKWDAYSLHFVSGPYFVLLFAVLYLLISNPLKNLAEGPALVLFAYLALSAWTLPDRLTVIPTRAGSMVGAEVNVEVIETLEKAIPAKSTLLVYPYLTGLYTLLDARVITRYDFLQPGMMGARDKQIMLDDVTRNPSQFIFWQNFPDEDVVRLWPSSNPAKHRFTKLENWIRANNDPGVTIPLSNIRGQVWARKQSTR